MTFDEWRSLVLGPRRIFRRRLFGVPAVFLLAMVPLLGVAVASAIQLVGFALGYDDNAVVVVPLALVTMLFFAALGRAFMPGRGELTEYRRTRGLCVCCRYRLGTAELGICPECGAGQG